MRRGKPLNTLSIEPESGQAQAQSKPLHVNHIAQIPQRERPVLVFAVLC